MQAFSSLKKIKINPFDNGEEANEDGLDLSYGDALG